MLRWMGLLGCATLLTGCQIPYLTSSAYNQLKILAQRQSIEKVLQNPSVSDKVKDKLRLARNAQEFAESTLGLAKINNYTQYVDLGRPYVTYIVHAAFANRLESYLWKFPFVGKVPYKGYFNEADARREAKSFDPQTYDTYVRGVTAYSTLGYFNDPLLSSMITYSDHDLVNTVIHESVHATVYINDHADFNERLATFLGDLGAELYYRQKEGEVSPTLKRIKDETHDQKEFSRFLTHEVKSLKAWYAEHPQFSADEKSARLAEIQNRYKSDLQPKLKTDIFANFLIGELNNARLLALGTYYQDLSLFQAVYEKLGRSFSAMLEFSKGLKKSKDPEESLREKLN